jgi:opacity protein-like surface antigen
MIGYVIDDDPADYLYGVANANLSYQFSDDSSIYVGARFGGSDIPGGSFIDDSIAGTAMSSGFLWGIGFSSSL